MIINKDEFFENKRKQELAQKTALELEKQKEENNALQAHFRTLVKSSREHIMNGEFDIALREAKEALKINSSSSLAAHPHSLIAEIYLKQDKLDEAITEINEALKYNEQYWYAQCVCAKIFYAGKDYEQMRQSIYKAFNSVQEKELAFNSLSDIPDYEEIINTLEEEERNRINEEDDYF